jgi:hypothetical protein
VTRSTFARAVLALFLTASVAACTPRVVGEITAATPVVDVVSPRFEVDQAATRIDRFDPPGAGAGLSVTVAATATNPNPFDMTVERLAYTLSLAGQAVAEGVLEPGLFVPRLGEATVSWTVDASLAEHPTLWRAVVGTYAGEPLPFAVEGQLRFLSDAYAFTTGVRPLFSGTLSARETIQPPRLAVVRRAHEVIVVRPDAPAVRLALEVGNPGDVGYFVSGRGLALGLLLPRAPAEVAVAGVAAPPSPGELAEVLTVGFVDLPPLPVPAGASVRTDLLVYLEPAALSPAARARLDVVLEGGVVPFVLDGRFVYDVLGVDSFLVPREGPLFGVFGEVPPAR